MSTRQPAFRHRRRAIRATMVAAVAAGLLALGSAVASAAPPALVKDINTAGSSDPYDLIDVGGTIFFAATLNGTNATYFELWRTDGTKAGTRRVKHTGYTDAQDLTDVHGRLFFEADAGDTGYELWTSDGTAAGTRLAKDINPSGDSSPSSLTAVGREAPDTVPDTGRSSQVAQGQLSPLDTGPHFERRRR